MKPTKGLIYFLLFSILLISFSFYAFQIVYTPNVLVEKENRLLIVPPGATFKTVQDVLHKGDYVQDLMSFSFLARLTGYDKHVKSGRYLLRKGMTNLEALHTLRLGVQETVKIT